MASCWLRLCADIRLRWRAMVSLAVLLGLVGSVVLTAAAGARRTDTAYPRLLQWANAAQVTVITNNAVAARYFASLARRQEVASLATVTQYNMALPVPGGDPDPQVQVYASPDGAFGVSSDRVRIVSGAMFSPAGRGEAVIDPRLAAREHLRPSRWPASSPRRSGPSARRPSRWPSSPRSPR